MEALSCLLKRAVSGGFLLACKVRGRGGEGAHVSHLLFADDTLVFSGATQDQKKYLSWTLMWFEAISGLIINLDKSKLIPVGCVENVKVLVAKLGCKVRSLPSSYLGLPLGALFKFVATWYGVEERFRKRLAMWKRKYISKERRLTLIRSTLANLPIYFMFVLTLPRTVRLRLEQIQRDFLQGGGALERKPHLALWNQVIRGKYGEEQGSWCSKEMRSGYGVGLWKAIRKECHVLSSRISFMVGNATFKGTWVKDVWIFTEGGGSWSLHFSRPFNDWEIDEVHSFLLGLNGKSVRRDVEDRVLWIETKCGKFSVKSLYQSPRI
ncbi:hypothetical protein CK203_047617 [Vitis vinifera]|uniref:Reverse transcriptase domain-containing protein n=1 Tax=Vitis vinifera TaxID=29760 RepID=A0A438H5D7_VITVI|nr:hypothetical protein CK203_047617 [Vitis vinifera]